MKATTLNFKKISVTLITTGVAQPIFISNLYVTEFELYCSSTNAGSIYVGSSDVNSTWIPRIPNTTISFNAEDIAGEPKQFDLSTIYVSGTSGDSVIIEYRIGL